MQRHRSATDLDRQRREALAARTWDEVDFEGSTCSIGCGRTKNLRSHDVRVLQTRERREERDLVYIRRLEAEAAADGEARRAEKERAAAHIARELLVPLEQRLARLLPSIPLDMQSEGLSLPVLQASLRGRCRGNCHPSDLGRALRKLGFKRERRWTSGAEFSAVWNRVGQGGGKHFAASRSRKIRLDNGRWVSR